MTAIQIIQLSAAALLPVIVSSVLYLADKKTGFGRLPYGAKQAVYGIVFGVIAVLGTEFGIPVLDVVMNARDAAPICAGLIFGSPAGVIAGLIGGIERFIRAPWVGEYTKIACSVSTALSGLFAAWLRKFMFDDKKPAWVYGLATGAIMEVVHMLMIFITNMDDAKNGFVIIRKCGIPMITMVSFSVMLSVLTVTLLAKEKLRHPKEQTKIAQTFQRRLLLCVLAAFVVTSTFNTVLQTGISKKDNEELMRLYISDVKTEINTVVEKKMASVASDAAERISGLTDVDGNLDVIAEQLNVSEINIINGNGIITSSTDEANIDFDMSSGEQSAEFLVLLDGRTHTFVQEYRETARDSSIFRRYAGASLGKNGFVQIGYDTELLQYNILQQVTDITKNRHIGENGYIMICSEDKEIISDINSNKGKQLSSAGFDPDFDSLTADTVYSDTVYDTESSWMFDRSDGFCIIAVRPADEILFERDLAIYIATFMEVIVFTALFIMVYFLIKKLIVNNIIHINNDLARITSGDLDVTVTVRDNEEFASLSDDINSTVDTLRHYIDEAAARIDKELEFAKTIQTSVLPTVFPSDDRFEIWASMNAAKEVGGDFYDFYMLDENTIAFMIADVSGKGIPAAMFMMVAKTMIKNLTVGGADIDTVFSTANSQLCENNRAEMFVTAWMGVIDLSTGNVTFVNAGHNPPVIIRADGTAEFLRTRPGLVLAGMDGIKYRKNEMTMNKGDMLYLYTDGVTEASNTSQELYGEDRLIAKLSGEISASVEEICKGVKSDVDSFTGDAPQFDDITMLGIKFR